MITTAPDCVFCKIVAGEIPSTKVYEDADVVCFKDLEPKAPVHVLAVPKEHYANIVELSANKDLLAAVVKAAGAVAKEHARGEFRFLFNTGESAGQSVFHVHGHILAGKAQSEGDLF